MKYNIPLAVTYVTFAPMHSRRYTKLLVALQLTILTVIHVHIFAIRLYNAIPMQISRAWSRMLNLHSKHIGPFMDSFVLMVSRGLIMVAGEYNQWLLYKIIPHCCWTFGPQQIIIKYGIYLTMLKNICQLYFSKVIVTNQSFPFCIWKWYYNLFM